MKNKIGIFMNFWENKWEADHVKYIRKAADIGFDVLEFQAQALLSMSKSKLDLLRAVSSEMNIELTYSLGLDPRYDISSTDALVRQKGIEYIKQILEKIYYMEGRILSGINYAAWGSPQKIINNKKQILENSINSMRDVMCFAENYGIDYCVEVVNRFEGCLLNTAREAIDYIEAVDSKNIAVLLDTYHMNIEEASLGDAIRLVGSHLGGFHVGENNRTAPGRGHIDWNEIFVALRDIGYARRIVSEPFVMMGDEVGRDIKVYRNLIEDLTEESLDKEAKYLLCFIRDLAVYYL